MEKQLKIEEDAQTIKAINSEMSPMTLHALTPGSKESQEPLSDIESKDVRVIDSSLEDDSDIAAKEAKIAAIPTESAHKKALHKSQELIKKTTILQRIVAADKPLESSEDASNSFA